MSTAKRKATNITLPVDVIDEARELGINLSAAAEKGVVAELTEQRRKRWLEENMEAIQAHNAWIEKNGLPLAKYRMF